MPPPEEPGVDTGAVDLSDGLEQEPGGPVLDVEPERPAPTTQVPEASEAPPPVAEEVVTSEATEVADEAALPQALEPSPEPTGARDDGDSSEEPAPDGDLEVVHEPVSVSHEVGEVVLEDEDEADGEPQFDDDVTPGAGEGAERRTIKRRRRRRRPAGAEASPDGAPEAQAASDTAAGGADADVPADPSVDAIGEAVGPATEDGESDADKDERGRLQMLIHVEGDRVQVSVLEGRSLVEHYVADRTSQSLAGNIYLGKVQNVLPGMEAAFVDIGTPKNAVLYAGDVRFIADEFETKSPRIEDILEVGQSVLVQVVKDPMGSKGARLTTEISLPGRFLVLVPESDTTGISRRLADSERERLRGVLRRIRPDGFGVIVRTAAEYTSEEKLSLDMDRLEQLWRDVYREATRANPPELVYEEPDLVIRTVREIFSGEFRRLIVDDKEVYDKICAYLEDYEPDLLHRIQHYEDDMSLYRRHHVSEQLRQGMARKVWLPSGGSLVFDSAEALTVIDVNTSKNVGKNSLEETVFQNNLEAAEEIGRQLRLRDIGGIIVIDFIDMETAKNRQAVLRAFRDAVARDKTKTQVYDISELGLVEMTRKNVSEGLVSAFSHSCAECGGRGIIIDEDF